jgi:hypothetical protein
MPAMTAHAEVKLEGDVAALPVTTDRDTISAALSALAAAFNVHYRTTIRLDAAAQAITPTGDGGFISWLQLYHQFTAGRI